MFEFDVRRRAILARSYFEGEPDCPRNRPRTRARIAASEGVPPRWRRGQPPGEPRRGDPGGEREGQEHEEPADERERRPPDPPREVAVERGGRDLLRQAGGLLGASLFDLVADAL